MHPNQVFASSDEAAALALVTEVAFGQVFLQTPAGPRLANVPFLHIDGALRFHLANGNALARHLGGATALINIIGPNAYISPNWYVGEDQVPTWNYVSVEIEGPVRELARAELVELLDQSAATFEPRVGENWTRAKMSPARFEAMCGAITGFEMSITAIRATHKLSQNKSDADHAGVFAALAANGNEAIAQRMARARKPAK
jgi:transcriptional regulator